MKKNIAFALLVSLAGYKNAHGTEQDEARAKNELIHALSKSHDSGNIEKIFNDPRLAIVSGESPKGEFGLMSDDSVGQGVDYWHEHRTVLGEASRTYRVPEEMIVSIMRVETNFGGNLGRDPALNTLYTIYARRHGKKEYALKEIDALLKYAAVTQRDIFEIPGSREGAIGLPQFMPSSYSAYAVDGNEDGIAELFSHTDAIMSAANFLAAHGWAESAKSQHDAVFAYNHSERYVRAIFTYARAVREAREKESP